MNIIASTLDWTGHLLGVAGLLISLWGFKRTRKHGYVLIGFALLVSIVISLVLPSVNRIRAHRYFEEHPAAAVDRELAEQILEAQQQAREDILIAHNKPTDLDGELTIKIRVPVYQLLLVLGLWLLVKNEKPNQRFHSIATPVNDPGKAQAAHSDA